MGPLNGPPMPWVSPQKFGSFINTESLLRENPRGFINPDFMKAGYLCQGGYVMGVPMIKKARILIIPKGPRVPPVGPRDPPVG